MVTFQKRPVLCSEKGSRIVTIFWRYVISKLVSRKGAILQGLAMVNLIFFFEALLNFK